MQPEGPLSPNHEALGGLPPVTPPSGKFIAQLFLVPGVIVAVAVGCIWFVTWLVGGFYTPEQFLKDLRSSNVEVRWRRASDLAQVLKRDEALAANPSFALDLAELLRQGLSDSDKSEREWADLERKQPKQPAGAPTALPQLRQGGEKGETPEDPTPKPLRDERAFVKFLIACLGNFSVPAGVPLLNEIARKETGHDPEQVVLRRQLAVWALANVAENLKRYDALSAEQRDAILAALATEADSPVAHGAPLRSQWARETLDFLQARASQAPQALKVDESLAKCAAADDPTLRKFTALALTFWQGSPSENLHMEETLLQLSRPGEEREIRYQAVQALARRGSDKATSRIGVLNEMLDEEFLAKTFQVKLQDGRKVPDSAVIGVIMTGALKGLSELQRKNPSIELTPLLPAIHKLAQSDNPLLRKEAERTLIALKRK